MIRLRLNVVSVIDDYVVKASDLLEQERFRFRIPDLLSTSRSRMWSRRIPKLRSYTTTTRPSRQNILSPYIIKLRQTYPNAEPTSLVASFLILHELTAVIPLFVGFWSFKALGLGTGLVAWAVDKSEEGDEENQEKVSGGIGEWSRKKVGSWIRQGEEQSERIGRRYGVLGFEKESVEEREMRKEREALDRVSSSGNDIVMPRLNGYNIGGDVANLVASYIAVKVSQSFAYYRRFSFICHRLCFP